jgi:hypothetical protein
MGFNSAFKVLKAWAVRESNPDWDKKIFFPPRLSNRLWRPKQPGHEAKYAEVNNKYNYMCIFSGAYVTLCSGLLY